MHFFAAALVPADTTLDNAGDRVTELFAPFDEELEVEQVTEDGETYWRNPDGRWDWWQIGGRWTGVWSDYDPDADPANVETCRLCGGTGRRPDAAQIERANPGWLEWSKGCNGCQGKGTRTTWPTSWKPTTGDILPVAAFLDNPDLQRPFALVTPEGGWVEKETWNPERKDFDKVGEQEWAERLAKLLTPVRDVAALVVVDYHI